MRLGLVGLPLLAVVLVCSDAGGAPKKKRGDTTQPLERACTVDDCFHERDVRDFEVIDQTTVIVYVGPQRCAFKMELHGTFCDLTFAPELYFHSPNSFEHNDGISSITGLTTNHRNDVEVCSNDMAISVDGGAFTENPASANAPDRYGNRRSECQISNVVSMTDDEILEFYVKHGVAPPPPPMGAGEIEVGEQKDDAEQAATAGDAPTAKSETEEGARPEAADATAN